MLKKEPVKKTQKNFLLLLLDSISEGLKPKDIAKKLGKTRQALNYHLTKQRKLGTIRRLFSYPFAKYELTSLGESVKKSLRQSEHIKALWKAHNLIVGFRVKHLGKFNFIETTRRKLIKMRNWSYAREELGEYVINVQDTGLLKIYPPAKYCRDPDIAFGEMFAECQKIAQWYVDRYDMRLEPMKVIRKGQKTLIKSSKLAKIFGRVKLEKMWVDASDGTEELEEEMDSYAIEKFLKLPDVIQNQLTPTLEKFSRNIELHLEVLEKIGAAIEKLNKQLGGSKNETLTHAKARGISKRRETKCQ